MNANDHEAKAKLDTDVRAARLHGRGVGHLLADLAGRTQEAAEQDRALRDTRPRTRRWKALDKLDDVVDRARLRHSEAMSRMQQAEEALNRAPADDSRALAGWIGAGEKGSCPAASLYERQRERDAAELLVAAALLEVDRALERRLHHIEDNRQKMVADARRDIEAAHDRIVTHSRQLPALRQTLLNAREALIWCASYPEPTPSYGNEVVVALGLAEPIKRTLGINTQILFAALIATLEADAAAVAGSFSAAQNEKLGTPAPRTPVTHGMWDSDPANIEWKRQELERARAIAEYHPNPDKVAAEIRESRP